MITPIDGSDPPEPPLTLATFDSRNRSIRAKSRRGQCLGIYGDVLPGAAIGCDSDRALAMSESLGHEWGQGRESNGQFLFPRVR